MKHYNLPIITSIRLKKSDFTAFYGKALPGALNCQQKGVRLSETGGNNVRFLSGLCSSFCRQWVLTGTVTVFVRDSRIYYTSAAWDLCSTIGSDSCEEALALWKKHMVFLWCMNALMPTRPGVWLSG